MKTLAPAIALILFLPSTSDARLIETYTYQELVTASDLVVIATPKATADTKEEANLPGMNWLRVTGVETRFTLLTTLKGDEKLKDITLHHYRVTKTDMKIENRPHLVAFDPAARQTYLLFLTRQPDGRYAPAGGQTDPASHSIWLLKSADK